VASFHAGTWPVGLAMTPSASIFKALHFEEG
jgi:hypothetical protein